MKRKTRRKTRLKKLDEASNYLIEEVKHNKMMSIKHNKVSIFLNYIEHLLILVSAITRCVSISALTSLVGIPIDIACSAAELKICVITAGIKNISY